MADNDRENGRDNDYFAMGAKIPNLGFEPRSTG
jgi:hypothetical protein